MISSAQKVGVTTLTWSSPVNTAIPTPKKKLGQIILRMDDEHGHHIIRANDTGYPYTVEGYASRPENYSLPPAYFLPMDVVVVKLEFEKQGKEWRV